MAGGKSPSNELTQVPTDFAAPGLQLVEAVKEAASMMKLSRRRANHKPRNLTLPELEQSKTSVLNTLSSMQSRRSYQHAMDEFIAWYCSEPRLALNRAVVLRYRMHLENIPQAPTTINLRLAAVRRLANAASDNGLLSPELVAGIRRVKGVKRFGQAVGNGLTTEEGQQLLGAVCTDTLRGRRDAAMLGLLLGYGLRPSEVANLEIERIQRRDGHGAIVDLVGKGGHVRTVPVPLWVKTAIDNWSSAAGIGEGRLFRAIRKNSALWGSGVSQNAVWYVVKDCAKRAGIEKLAPHDLRRSCARMCHMAGGEIEQIQFLLGHASVQTTERYIGCKQKLGQAVNDRIEFRLGTN
jgi:site-specific recombinase XerD